MTSFILFAALLIVAVIAILLPPLLRAPKPSAGADHREANLAIFRDQLAELERERDNGALDLADFEQAQNELQRRLLDEVQPRASAPSETRPGRKTALALLVVLPLAAAGGYALLGNQQALDPLQRQARITPQQIEGMVAGLVEKLKENPDDSKGWLMLARSYKVLERFPQAAEAYGRAGALVDQNPELLADYAEVLSRSQGGDLQGKPTELVERALKIDPNEPQALLLAGAAASDRQQFALAADYWARLLAQIEPGSEEAKALAAAVERARAIAAQTAAAEPAGQTSVASGSGSQRRSDAERRSRWPGQSGRRALRLCPPRRRSAHAARRDTRKELATCRCASASTTRWPLPAARSSPISRPSASRHGWPRRARRRARAVTCSARSAASNPAARACAC
jgi:cytochrome c-type biogenesis protein CcmH